MLTTKLRPADPIGSPERTEVAEAQPDRASDTFAQRLDLLFRATHPRDRNEVGYQEVADALVLAGGPKVTPNYLYMLRTGRRTNPRMDLVRALARYFNVPAGYFIDDDVAEKYTEQLQLLQALRDSGLAGLVLSAQGLSPESQEVLTAILDRLRAADGLSAQQRPPSGDKSAPDQD